MVQLLNTLDLREIKNKNRYILNLLNIKNKAEYEENLMSVKNAESAKKSAERFLDYVESILNE